MGKPFWYSILLAVILQRAVLSSLLVPQCLVPVSSFPGPREFRGEVFQGKGLK